MVAVFNRQPTQAELVDNLSAIAVSGVNVRRCKVISDDDPSTVMFEYEGNNALFECKIEGSELVLSDPVDMLNFYLFDLDYKEQHKKVFDLNQAYYMIDGPLFLERGAGREQYYPVFKVGVDGGELSAVYVKCVAGENDTYALYGANSELTDIDVASIWDGANYVNGHAFILLVTEILKMEYNLPNFEPENVIMEEDGTGFSVDGGTWNLFTDGEDYRPAPVVPLRVVSRFGGLTPPKSLFLLGPEEKIELLEFNRVPALSEIANMDGDAALSPTKVIVSTGSIETIGLRYADGVLSFAGDNIQEVTAELVGNKLYITQDGEAVNVWDVDFNQQHKRTLAYNFPLNSTAQALINVPVCYNGLPVVMLANWENGQRIRCMKDENGAYKTYDQQTGVVEYVDFETPGGFDFPVEDLISQLVGMEFENIEMGSLVEDMEGSRPTKVLNFLNTTEIS